MEMMKKVHNNHHHTVDKAMNDHNKDSFPPLTLKKLRRILDQADDEEISKALIIYTKFMEFLIIQLPSMPVVSKVDWAISVALCPDWYNEKLVSRLQNSMLVAALLLTVTSTILIVPPYYNYGIDVDTHEGSYRLFLYIDILCTLMFLSCIFFGVCFIENGMSRAYTDTEKFTLIIKQYPIKDACQITSVIGFILFPFTLAIPLWSAVNKTDFSALMILTGIYSIAVIYVQVSSMRAAAEKQAQRTRLFLPITDDSGRLLPEYYPPGADMTVEDFADMFSF